MVWYGLAKKNGRCGTPYEAIETLNHFWEAFTATTRSEKALNTLAFFVGAAREHEALGFGSPILNLNPRSAISQALYAGLPHLGVRREYFDFEEMLKAACPEFEGIEWDYVTTRLMIGATEVKNGIETVFDSDKNMTPTNQDDRHTDPRHENPWRTRLRTQCLGGRGIGNGADAAPPPR